MTIEAGAVRLFQAFSGLKEPVLPMACPTTLDALCAVLPHRSQACAIQAVLGCFRLFQAVSGSFSLNCCLPVMSYPVVISGGEPGIIVNLGCFRLFQALLGSFSLNSVLQVSGPACNLGSEYTIQAVLGSFRLFQNLNEHLLSVPLA